MKMRMRRGVLGDIIRERAPWEVTRMSNNDMGGLDWRQGHSSFVTGCLGLIQQGVMDYHGLFWVGM